MTERSDNQQQQFQSDQECENGIQNPHSHYTEHDQASTIPSDGQHHDGAELSDSQQQFQSDQQCENDGMPT